MYRPTGSSYLQILRFRQGTQTLRPNDLTKVDKENEKWNDLVHQCRMLRCLLAYILQLNNYYLQGRPVRALGDA